MQGKQSLTTLIEFRANDAICSMNGASGNSTATRLIQAIYAGNWNEVNEYLAAGDDVDEHDSNGNNPLIYAIGQRYGLIWNQLQRKGGSFHMYDGQFDLNGIQLLLAHQANVNRSNRFGTTPLMCAAVSGQYRVIERLLSQGAHINAVNNDGRTALHYAICWRGHKREIAELLLANGADINAQTHKGYTTLMQAVAGYEPYTTLFLLEAGADPNISDYQGYTALHSAAEIAVDTGNFELIKLLLRWNANLSQCNFEHWSGLPNSGWHRYKEFAQLLQIVH